jgi:hypothetical protein
VGQAKNCGVDKRDITGRSARVARPAARAAALPARGPFDVACCEAVPMLTLNCHPNTYVHGLAGFMHQFVINNAALLPTRLMPGSQNFILERDRAFSFAMNRLMCVAVRT